ncbi:MAG: DUF2911 domain-containing protein [Vicinamibacterales bacterium]
MRMSHSIGVVLALGFLASTGLVASQEKKRASPHETVSATVDGAKISVTYGRPYAKGRKIVGGLVPYGQVWRTGADEATTLVTDEALMFGSTHVSPGTYTLYTLPSEKEWQLIINKQTGQWGTAYDQAQDLARIPMTVSATGAPVEQLTIAIADTPGGGELRLSWENTQATAPFTVMQ